MTENKLFPAKTPGQWFRVKFNLIKKEKSCYVTSLHMLFHRAIPAANSYAQWISVVMTGRFAVFPKTKVYVFLSPRESLSEILHKRLDCAKVDGI